MHIELEIHTIPVPKARARVTKWGAYTPKKTQDFENLIAHAFMESKQPKLQGPLYASVNFGMPIPKSWSKTLKSQALSGELKPYQKPDIDNLFKSVTDALNGLAYDDDGQIVSIACSKFYTDKPVIYISIFEQD